MNWFKTGKGVCKAVYCHPDYLTYMKTTSCDEAQAGIKIARRNISNLTYADDTTLMAKSEDDQRVS